MTANYENLHLSKTVHLSCSYTGLQVTWIHPMRLTCCRSLVQTTRLHPGIDNTAEAVSLCIPH